MNLIFGLAPFIVFTMLIRLSQNVALWVAFATAFVISIRDFVETRSIKLLDISSLALFGLMAFYTGFIQTGMSFGDLRLVVDLGLLLVILGSIILRQPLSLQYAKEDQPQEPPSAPKFLRHHYILTSVWGLAFIVMAVADAFAALDSRLPEEASVAAALISLGAAITFTLRYPAYIRRHDSGA